VSHRVVRREPPDEHRTSKRAGRPPSTQIVDQGTADVARERQLVISMSLAVDRDRSGAPIDLIERQPGDLTTAQPEPTHQ
jgi:hypothetical protein